MNKKWKDEWIKALESGNYQQGTGRLRGDGGAGSFYCCLGVLCDVVKDEIGFDWKEHWKLGMCFTSNDGATVVDGLLPVEVCKLVGLHPNHPWVFVKNGADTSTLSAMNDNGLTFTEIAQIIREQL